jgi:hypothetical protein
VAATLSLLRQRIEDLDKLADEVLALADRKFKQEDVQGELSIKGQQWYRGVRELMVQNGFSGVDEFDDCYMYYPQRDSPRSAHIRGHSDLEACFSGRRETVPAQFNRLFMKARSLANSLEAEVLSRELPVKSQLSFEVSASELETAENVLAESKGEEALMRASGVIARVALERHLYTVADVRKLQIVVNPPSKKHPDVEDVMQTLQRNGVITAIQKSQLDSLFKVANNCAHPEEAVNQGDVERLIRDGKQLASVIL